MVRFVYIAGESTLVPPKQHTQDYKKRSSAVTRIHPKCCRGFRTSIHHPSHTFDAAMSPFSAATRNVANSFSASPSLDMFCPSCCAGIQSFLQVSPSTPQRKLPLFLLCRNVSCKPFRLSVSPLMTPLLTALLAALVRFCLFLEKDAPIKQQPCRCGKQTRPARYRLKIGRTSQSVSLLVPATREKSEQTNARAKACQLGVEALPRSSGKGFPIHVMACQYREGGSNILNLILAHLSYCLAYS